MRASLLAMGLAFGASTMAACAQGGGGPDSGSPADSRTPMDARMTDANRPRDTGRRDTGPPVDARPRMDTGGDLDAGQDAGRVEEDAGPPCALGEGTLVIVEIMISSRSGSLDRGEWFEVVNTQTDCSAPLAGLVIESPTGSGAPKTHTVSAGVVPPGGHYVFALSAAPADNHGLTFDYAYGTGSTTNDVIFNNTDDALVLRSGGTVVDEIAWPSSGFTHGTARQFPSGAPYAQNATWGNWCDATETYSTAEGGPYLGTPGSPNGTCP